jgi:hypothetical protein
MSPSSSNLSNASPNFLIFDNTVKDATRRGSPASCAISFLGDCRKIFMASRQAGESARSTQSIKSTNGLDDLLGQAFRPVGEFFNSVLAHFVLYGLHTDDSIANTIGAGEIRFSAASQPSAFLCRLCSHTDTNVIVAAKHCPILPDGTVAVTTRFFTRTHQNRLAI